MSLTYKNSDFILTINDNSLAVNDVVNKYETFLEVLCDELYSFQREAIKTAIRFFVSASYSSTEQLAISNYNQNAKIRSRYNNLAQYLELFPLRSKKSISIDLATGTGKSWVIYGIAQIMLAEGLIDKVLVLCPSLTIEEGLKDKFNQLSGNANLKSILSELGTAYSNPAIKSANDPILDGDICVENIHAVYERTGSSIYDSFKNKGTRVLVLNDEAHHIFSGVDAATKKWLEFLNNPDYNFNYIVNLSGTPYIDDQYFLDVVYRYGLKQAMEDGVVKRIDYKLEEESQREKGFYETYANHNLYKEQYAGILKPITIVVTEKIVSCVQVWRSLTTFIAEKESISFEEAAKKVIWVASGIPSGNDGEVVKSIVQSPDKVREANIRLLKTVDSPDNPVEWIISVSMLTEGWDVKNVFQIVPYENRAFNSKLLIAQVLGRGLRIPLGLQNPIFVKINNHEKWTESIEQLYKDVLEIENHLSWGYHKDHSQYKFSLYNLNYDSVLQTVETKHKLVTKPGKPTYFPQSKQWTETSTYSVSGEVQTVIENQEIMSITVAARQLKIFINEKDATLAAQWTVHKLEEFLKSNLRSNGYSTDFISKENFAQTQQAFGPMFRAIGEENPRMIMRPDDLYSINIEEVSRQSFTESSIKNDGCVFYTDSSIRGFQESEQALFSDYLMKKSRYNTLVSALELIGQSDETIHFLKDNFVYIDAEKFKTPWNIFYVSYQPEKKFTQSLFHHSSLFDCIIKSPDKSFYSFPYSYKPETRAKTHPKRENFNPDFFLKLFERNEILVVEIKKDDDDNYKNRAKYRSGVNHFQMLNNRLTEQQIDWTYYFYFLSEANYPDFFQIVREKKYAGWKSGLMIEMER